MDGLFFACLMGICGSLEPPVPPAASTSALLPNGLLSNGTLSNVTTSTAQPIERPVPRAEPPQRHAGAALTAGNSTISKATITEMVRRKSGAIRRCYELGLLEDGAFRGIVEMGWKIGVDGRVASVSVVGSSMANSAAQECLVAEISRWEFPPSSEPIAVGVYPFVFDATLLARHGGAPKARPSR